MNLPFILLAAALNGTAEALTVGFVSTFAQCLPRERRKINAAQLAFNCCAIVLASGAARWIFTSSEVTSFVAAPALRLAVAAVVYFLANTVLVALVISLTEPVNVVRTWIELFQLSFVYMVASAGVAGLSLAAGHEVVWQVPLVLLPIMLGIYQSYRRYFAVAVNQTAPDPAAEASRATAGAHV